MREREAEVVRERDREGAHEERPVDHEDEEGEHRARRDRGLRDHARDRRPRYRRGAAADGDVRAPAVEPHLGDVEPEREDEQHRADDRSGRDVAKA